MSLKLIKVLAKRACQDLQTSHTATQVHNAESFQGQILFLRVWRKRVPPKTCELMHLCCSKWSMTDRLDSRLSASRALNKSLLGWIVCFMPSTCMSIRDSFNKVLLKLLHKVGALSFCYTVLYKYLPVWRELQGRGYQITSCILMGTFIWMSFRLDTILPVDYLILH